MRRRRLPHRRDGGRDLTAAGQLVDQAGNKIPLPRLITTGTHRSEDILEHPLTANTASSAVTIYTTEWCPYCDRVKSLLDNKGVSYTEVDVDSEAERLWLTEKTGQKTVPQVFVGERHIGGWDDISSLERAGKLIDVLS